MEHTIYVITNEVNGKEYVGVTSDLKRRWRRHRADARRGVERYLYHAMRKYEVEQFSIQVVDHAEAREQAYELEKQWIADLDTYHGEGYNMTPGGDGFSGTGEDHPMYGRTGEDHPMHGVTGEDHPGYATGADNPMHGLTGGDNPNSTLGNSAARVVKWYVANSTLTQAEIGEMFGVSDATVSMIKTGRRYPSVAPNPPADNGQLRLPLGAT